MIKVRKNDKHMTVKVDKLARQADNEGTVNGKSMQEDKLTKVKRDKL